MSNKKMVDQEETRNKNRGCGCSSTSITLTVIILAIISLGFWAMVLTMEDDENEDDEITASKVSTICELIVENRLKSPKTAEFEKYRDQEIGKFEGEETYQVLSYVDAQNSFGALIRTHYECVVSYKGGEWTDLSNWDLEKLEVDE